jgi:structural maintenance of chromosome 3 (chondroitin sulfate proteoglycan 6)
MLEIDLSENLRRRREELEVRIESLGDGGAAGLDDAGDDADTLETRQAELAALAATIADLATRLTELEGEADKAREAMTALEGRLDKAQTAQAEDGKNIAKQQKAVERYHARRRVAQQRKDECNAKIRELGVLPEEAFGKYTTTRMEKVPSVPTMSTATS